MTLDEATALRDAAIDKFFELDQPRLLTEILLVLVQIREVIENQNA